MFCNWEIRTKQQWFPLKTFCFCSFFSRRMQTKRKFCRISWDNLISLASLFVRKGTCFAFFFVGCKANVFRKKKFFCFCSTTLCPPNFVFFVWELWILGFLFNDEWCKYVLCTSLPSWAPRLNTSFGYLGIDWMIKWSSWSGHLEDDYKTQGRTVGSGGEILN